MPLIKISIIRQDDRAVILPLLYFADYGKFRSELVMRLWPMPPRILVLSLVLATGDFYNDATLGKGSGALRRFLLLLCGAGGSVLSMCLLICVCALPIDSISSLPSPTPNEKITLPYRIPGTQLVARKLACYEGPYLEDNCEDEVVDVAALMLENVGSTGITEASVKLNWKDGTYTFAAYMIPPGETVLVCDIGRKAFQEKDWISCTGRQVVSTADWSSYDQLNVWYCGDGKMEVHNISGHTLRGIQVLYKNYLSPPGTYVGGVFYSIDIPELQPGERVRLPAWRYVQDQSRVVYIGCKELADCH